MSRRPYPRREPRETPAGLALGGGWDRSLYPGDLDVTISRASNSTTPPIAWIVEPENKGPDTLYPKAEVMCAAEGVQMTLWKR